MVSGYRIRRSVCLKTAWIPIQGSHFSTTQIIRRNYYLKQQATSSALKIPRGSSRKSYTMEDEPHSQKECSEKIPIYRKMTLTIREAAEYSNIGINKIDSMLKEPNCPFVLFVGTKKLVKRQEFENYIRGKLVI